MKQEQIKTILSDIQRYDDVADFALSRAVAEHEAGNIDRASELMTEYEGAKGFRNGLISALSVCGIVAGIDHNTHKWVTIRRQ